MIEGLEHLTEAEELQIGEIGSDLNGISPNDLYKAITDKILEAMKEPGLAWRQTWKVKKDGFAKSHRTKKEYTGVNSFLLNMVIPFVRKKAFATSYFCTPTEIKEKGWMIKKGSKAFPIYYYTAIYKYDNKNISKEEYEKIEAEIFSGKREKTDLSKLQYIAIIKYYNVFNGEDIEGHQFEEANNSTDPVSENEKIEICEQIIENFPKPAPKLVRLDPGRAFYRSDDIVNMPPLKSFGLPQEYYSTYFHELIHATGSPNRLNRKKGKKFGDRDYAFEELVAELGACFVNAEAGILYFNIKNSAAYLKSWKSNLLKFMASDVKFFPLAIAGAQKAANFLLNLDSEGIPSYRANKLEVVTKENYYSIAPKIDSNKKILKIGKELFLEDFEGSKIVDFYYDDETIKKAVDTHLNFVNAELNAVGLAGCGCGKDSTYFIKEFGLMNGKTFTKNQLLNFLEELQKFILAGAITKADPFASIVEKIQKQLVAIINGLSANQKVKINISEAHKYQNIQQGLGFIPVIISAVVGNFIQKKLEKKSNLGSIDPSGIIVGEISKAVAKKAHIQEAKIYLEHGNSKFGLVHIELEHSKELNQLGINAETFVKFICDNYNEIYQEKGNKLILSVNFNKPRILVITLKKDDRRKNFYRVITTGFKSKNSLKKLKLLFSESPSSDSTLGLGSALVKMLSNKTETTPLRARQKEVSTNIQKSNQNPISGVEDSLFVRADQRNQIEVPGTFTLPGQAGKFLQKIQPYKCAIVLTGDPHAGKTQVLFQFVDAFLDANKTVGIFSLEQGGIESKDTQLAIDRNVKKENHAKLNVAGEAPEGIETLKKYAKQFDVVAVDSWNKLNISAKRFDELRNEFPNTIWIVIFQQNAQGGTSGGSASEYDANIVLKVHKEDNTFINNWVEMKKNRGNLLTYKYMVAAKKTVPLIDLKEKKETKK